MRKTIIAFATAILLATVAYGTDYSNATYKSTDGRTTVAFGASQGWQTLRIETCEKYISAAECGGDIYIRRDTDSGQRWEKANEKEKTEFQKIASAATGSSQIDLTGKDRIVDSLVAKKTSIKLSILNASETSAGYIPYALMPGTTAKCTFTIIGITGEKAVATLSGATNSNSGIYNGSVDSNVTWSVLTEEDKKDASELVAYSIMNDRDSETELYSPGDTGSGSPHLKAYLTMLYGNNHPVLESERFAGSKKDTNLITEADSGTRALMVKAALRYLNWAVEYMTGLDMYNDAKIFDKVSGDGGWGTTLEGTKTQNYWPTDESEFPQKVSEDGTLSGNPVPYSKCGIDTPRTFWKKMLIQYSANKINQPKILWNSVKSLFSGTIATAGGGTDSIKYAGTDSLGLLTGVISMSGNEGLFKGKNEKTPGVNLDLYSKSVDLITEGFLNKYKQNKISEITEPTDLSRARYNEKDIEGMSFVVPEYPEVEPGDILVSLVNGSGGLSIAVVVEADNAADRTGIKVVYIREEDHGTAEKASWSELPNAWSYTARRLLLDSNTGNEKEDYTDADYDIMGVQAASAKITTKGRREQTQATEEDWRFIPNTGEYLKLSIESVVLYNKAGIELQRLYEGRYTLEPAAKDRGYEKDPEQTQGNIYANRATEFQTVYFSGDATVEGSELSITSKKTTETDTSGKESCNMVYSGEGTMRLELQNDGKIKYTDGNKNIKTGIDIGYRPTSAAKAYPGDDLIPGFKAVYSYDDKSLNGFVFDEEKNYIAVYDKKLLWRANLYIDEGDGDWNNAHPWNAPADSSAESAMTTGKTLPEWWNKDWGYNEWNRKYNLNQNSSDSISKLAVGNGGQVVKFSGYTSLRSEKGDEATMDSVCYDYNNGTVNAWDSPFDFIWKMNKQKEAMASHFKTKTATAEESKKTGEFPETKTTTIEGNEVTNKTLSDWPHTHAPNSRWKFYWKESENGSSPYIPGLGFWKEKGSVTCTGENQSTLDAISFPSGLSSGTDCIGFAERAANYKDNPYKWTAC